MEAILVALITGGLSLLRVPVLEEQLRVANHRLSNLEKAHTPAGRAIS